MKRVIGAQMEAATAWQALQRAEREKGAPHGYLDRLRDDYKLAVGNLEQAWAAENAMRRYPPCS